MSTKTQTNYHNSIIYKIVCKDTSIKDCYIGATTNFAQRKAKHKRNCNTENSKCHNFRVYKCIRDQGGWDNWDMVMVNRCSCEDKLELRKKERHAVELFNSTLNMVRPYITNEERKISALKYYHEHSDEIKIKRKQYFIDYNIKRKGTRKAYAKEYSQRPEVKEKKRLYYQKRREEKKKLEAQTA